MAEFRLSNFTSGTALTAAELNTGLTFTDYTPTWTQSVAITKTVNFARYTKFGKLIIGTVKMTATSAGTANNKILVGLPVAASADNLIMGGAILTLAAPTPDANVRGFLMTLYESSSTVSFIPTQTANTLDAALRTGQTGISGDITIASGDIIYVQFQYEAA